MGEGARTLSSPSSHLEACLSPSPSRPLRCSALRCIAPGCWCPPVRQLVALITSLGVICCWSYPPCWDGGRMGPLRAFRRLHFALALSAPVSCPAPISIFFSFVSSGRRAHGTRTQATKKRCRYGLRLRRPVNRFSLPSSPPTPRISSPIPRSTSKSTRSLSGGVSGVHLSPPTRRAIADDHLLRIPQTHNPASPQPAARRPLPAARCPPAVGRERGRTSHFGPHPTVDSNATFQTLLPTDAPTPSPFATHSQRTTAKRSHTLEALADPAVLSAHRSSRHPTGLTSNSSRPHRSSATHPRRAAAAVFTPQPQPLIEPFGIHPPPPIRTPFRPLYGSGLLPKACRVHLPPNSYHWGP